MSNPRTLPHTCYCEKSSSINEKIRKKFLTIKGLVKATSVLMKQKEKNKTTPYSFEELFNLLEEKIEEMDSDLSTL